MRGLDGPLRRQVFESDLEALLASWSADIVALKARSKRSSFEATVHYCDFITELQHKHDLVSQHLSSLRGAHDEIWESLKASAEECVITLHEPQLPN